MCFYGRTNSDGVLWRLARLILCITLQFGLKDRVESHNAPSRADFAKCTLSTEDREKFVDEHNRLRGMVSPQAADMEFLFWDDDLANLAQMWSYKCSWYHGFDRFGTEYPYPHPKFPDVLGQNLAKVGGNLTNPSDRVQLWFNEREGYQYSKFTPPNGGLCSSPPCGHYTQLAWARTKYVGCGMSWCPNFYSTGGAFVACDYGPSSGNVQGEHPYQTGTPCSKCASGKGFCYKNLCRDCADFDSNCGTKYSQAMCVTNADFMEKKCPKLCNMCKCPLQCQNGGTLNSQTCQCSCVPPWTGTDCTERCTDRLGKTRCEQFKTWNGPSFCKSNEGEYNCKASCGYCDDGSGTFTTTVAPVQTTVPSQTMKPVTPAPTPAGIPTTLPIPTTPTSGACTSDLHSNCEAWAAIGECEKNPRWMLPNCCVSCKSHQTPKECIDSHPRCPLWAHLMQCEANWAWMQDNCRRSCNQCGDCKDTDRRCPHWALQKQCSKGSRIIWMNTKCRRSCGLCKAYDRHAECPAWAALNECKKSNWTWFVDHCPRSCNVPLSDALFCGGKPNGHYQDPSTCQAYIACSNEVTSHVQCPEGKKFDTVKSICEPADRAVCISPSKKSKSWKIIATLKRG